jgi:hypothetical protein
MDAQNQSARVNGKTKKRLAGLASKEAVLEVHWKPFSAAQFGKPTNADVGAD